MRAGANITSILLKLAKVGSREDTTSRTCPDLPRATDEFIGIFMVEFLEGAEGLRKGRAEPALRL